jgi:Bax protein
MIRRERQKLMSLKARLETGEFFASELRLLDVLASKYRLEATGTQASATESLQALLTRVDEIPVALVQVQAAVESGWGTSRFSREANNYFGQWCFEPGCGLVPKHRGAGKTHELAVFGHPRESVRAYLLNLNSFHAYSELRAIRKSLRAEEGKALSAQSLLPGLLAYSERGQDYVDQLGAMITANNLEPNASLPIE